MQTVEERRVGLDCHACVTVVPRDQTQDFLPHRLKREPLNLHPFRLPAGDNSTGCNDKFVCMKDDERMITWLLAQ